MLDYTRYTCPVCGQPFAEGEDVVVCPLCGAPHHRACWKRLGRCAHADTHGTAQQWKPLLVREDDGPVLCGNCGTPNAADALVCAKCGHTLEEELPPGPAEQQPPIDPSVFYSQFSPYIGIAPDSLVDGHPAMEVATFLGPNSGFYLSRFHFMKMQKSKFSWNWAAAFFPVEWLLYRKLYKPFLVVLAISTVLLIPSLMAVVLTYAQVAKDTAVLQQFLRSGVLPSAELPTWLVVVSNIAASATFILRAVMATIANHLYRRHTAASITRIKQTCSDPLYYRYALSKKGGTSVAAVVAFLVAVAIAAVTGSVILTLTLL